MRSELARLLFLALALGVHGGWAPLSRERRRRRKSSQQRYEREQLSAGAILGAAGSSVAFAVSSQLTRQVYPGGMAVRPLLRPMLSVQQRAAVAAAAALGTALATLQFAWRPDNAAARVGAPSPKPYSRSARLAGRKWCVWRAPGHVCRSDHPVCFVTSGRQGAPW